MRTKKEAGGKLAVTISAALVGRMERLAAKRKALNAKTWEMKCAEDAMKEEIKAEMGRYRRAAVGKTGRVVELVTVHQDKKVVEAYSYVLVRVVNPK